MTCSTSLLTRYDPEKGRFEDPPDLSLLPPALRDVSCPEYCHSCQSRKTMEQVRVCDGRVSCTISHTVQGQWGGGRQSA